MSQQIPSNLDKLAKSVESELDEEDSQHVEPLENVNRIQQRLAIQRIQERQKFVAHQEQLTKQALMARSRESNLILENKQLNIEPFQQSMSNQVCFPLFDEIHGESELWKLISKNILSSSTYLPQLSIQPSSHITQLVSQTNSSEALEQQQSFESIPPVSNTLTTTHLNATSEHHHPQHQQSQYHPQGTMISKSLKSGSNKDKHPSAFTLLRENRSVNEALSQEYLASALRPEMKEKRKMRRIKLSSLSKDMRDMLFHDDQLQLISKEVGAQKIDLNKPIVIIETNQEDNKFPSYNPSVNKVRNYSAHCEDKLAQSETILDEANSRVRRKSEINMLEQIFTDKEKTVQNHKNHNNFQNGGGNSWNEGKSSARLRIGKSPRSFDISKRDGGTREIRRKSCHCSECGDLTMKQICNYLFVREVDKPIRHRVLSHHSPRMMTLPPQFANNLVSESPRNHNHNNHSSFLVTNKDNPSNTNLHSNQWINSIPTIQQTNNNNTNSNHLIMGQSQSLNSSQQQQQSSSMLLSTSQHFQNPSSHSKTKQPLIRRSSLLQSQQQQHHPSLMKSSTNPHQIKQSYTISELDEHISQIVTPSIPVNSQVKINMKALHEQYKQDLETEEGIRSPFFATKASSRLIATTPQPGSRRQVQSNVQFDLPEFGYGNLQEQSKKYFRYHPNRTFLIRMEKKNQEDSIKQKERQGQLSHSPSTSPNYLFSKGSFHQRYQSTQLQQESIVYPSRGKISNCLLTPLSNTHCAFKGRQSLNNSQEIKTNVIPKSKKEQRLQIKQAKAVFALNCAKSAYLKTLSKDTKKKSNLFSHPKKTASIHDQKPFDAYLQKVGEVKFIKNNIQSSVQNVRKNNRSLEGSSGKAKIQNKRLQHGIRKNLSVSEVFYSDSVSQSTFGSSSGFSKKSPTNSNSNNDRNPYQFCNDYIGS